MHRILMLLIVLNGNDYLPHLAEVCGSLNGLSNSKLKSIFINVILGNKINLEYIEADKLQIE
jgi:hypothetical protein